MSEKLTFVLFVAVLAVIGYFCYSAVKEQLQQPPPKEDPRIEYAHQQMEVQQ
jgi:hypothetical protein